METFKVRQGKGKEEAIAAIRGLDDNESWDVSITKKRWNRTISQNNLYWLWLTCIEQETGNDRNYLHEYFKAKFLGFEEIEILGAIVTRVVSTTTRNTLQFKNYLDRVQMFASVELGIALPDPQDQHWTEFYHTYKYFL
jgi:hypothetical protein